MRYALVIAAFLTALFVNGLSAAEKLNILGLTLDMTIGELYAEIETYNESTGASSSTEYIKDLGFYLFKISGSRDRREMIIAMASRPEVNQKPIDINRRISAEIYDRHLFDDIEEALIEKYGDPQYRVPDHMIWMADEKGSIGECNIDNHEMPGFILSDHYKLLEDYKKSTSKYTNGCHATMMVNFSIRNDLQEKVVSISLRNPIAGADHDTNREKPKL